MDALLSPAVEAYLHGLRPPADAVQAEMEREGGARGFPIIGPLVGSLCGQLARAMGARTVFEMGSGFGYSTLHFARAVGPEGKVVHTDGDPELTREARSWLTRAGVAGHVEFESGDAKALLRARGGSWDIIFIDIDKEQYPEAWEIAKARVRPGGLIITDNALWSGRVAGPDHDAATQGVRAYNERAARDPHFVTTILPLRDGVAVSWRRP
ncbi:MAG: O-methyltransferase [Thermoplasmatota archaeon]